jgi:pimeloyl-ACP methyl ester carboxylesterase
MRRFALIVLLSIIGSLLGLDGPGAAPTSHAAFSGGNGKLLVRNITFPWQLASVEPDGSDFRILGDGFDGSWSPDGRKIVFDTLGTGHGIWIMDADGSNVTQILTGPTGDRKPTWSPDGAHIAFLSNRSGGTGESTLGVYTAKADGTDMVQLTDPGQIAIEHNSAPKWSPDGSKIIFIGQEPGTGQGWDVYSVPAAGGGLTRLSNTGAAGGPEWSPDGSKIVLTVGFNIAVMGAGGGAASTIATPGAGMRVAGLAWSPDGKKIAYSELTSSPPYTSASRVIDAGGGGGSVLPVPGIILDWQPVGPPVVFIHGFLGSSILCGGSPAWPDVPPDFDAMALGADGASPAPGACAATVGETLDSFLGSDVYGSVIDYLDQNYGDNASLFAWDWRKSPEPSLTELDAFIDDVLAKRNADKVVLMAHSYGGLLARWYIDSAARADKVAGVVTIGTPAWGAPKALFPLFAGIETPDFSPLDAIIPNDELKDFARNLFGNYFLYPSASYGSWLTLLPNNTPVGQQDLLNYVASLGGNPGLLSQALGRHASTLDSFPPSDVPFEVIVGAGLPTISGVRIDPNGHVIVEYDNGDGTVPARSAARGVTGPGNPNAAHTHYACGIGHVPLPGHPQITDAIDPFLRSGDPVDGLSDTACSASGLQFRIFSLSALPAALAAGADEPAAITPEEADTSGEVDYLDLPNEKFIITGETFPDMVLPAAEFLEITRIGDDGAKGEALRYGPFTGQVTVSPGDGWAVVLEDGGPVEGEPAVLSGDVDCSGAVNSIDGLKLLRHVAGLSVDQPGDCPGIGTAGASIFGDVNCDGSITAADALFVLRFVAALPANVPQGCRPVGT